MRDRWGVPKVDAKGKSKGAGPGAKTGTQAADLKKKLQKSVTMSLSFGGTALKSTAWLLRVLSWDPSVMNDIKTWVATRGVPVDDPVIGSDLRAKLALKLFEERQKDVTLNPQYSLGMALHMMRGPELPFPPGTLFEQREIVPARAGNPPRTVRISDSSGSWEHQRKRVEAGGYLHVANIHRDALLPPSQAAGYLDTLAGDQLKLDKIKDLAEPGRFNLGADAIVAALDATSDRPAYWAKPGHTSEYAEAANARQFYSFKHVATFREYCEFLWDAAKVIWAMGHGAAKPADLQDFGRAAKRFPDNNLTVEQKGEVYAGMQDIAQYLRAAGATSNAPYFAAGGKNVPGQQNLLDVAYYWVTHATDASDPRDPVGRNESDIMARYLNACYDFFQWAGAAGLFAFHKVGSTDEVAIITDGDGAQKKREVLADLQAIAEAEGLDLARLASEETEFTRNPRLHPTTPWSSLTGTTEKKVGKYDTVNRIELNILYHRIAKVFDLLRLWDWRKFTDRGVGTLVRQALTYVERDKKGTSGKKSGFAWIRLDLIKTRKKAAAGAGPKGKSKAAKKLTMSGSYLDSFNRLSYRYIVKYVGGHLHFFRQYVDLGMRERAAFWMKYCKDLHPLNRWRLYLEVAYMITLLTQRSAPKEEARSMAKLIKEVLPVVVGDQAFAGLASNVKEVAKDLDKNPDKEVRKELDKDEVVKEYQALIREEDWVELVERLYQRIVAKRARERGHAEAEQASTAKKKAPRQEYFEKLEKAAMLFIQKRFGTVLLLRHFYRSLYFYLPPEVPDFLPPMFLDKEDEKSFAMLLDQEAIAQRYLGRRPTGGKWRIRVTIPLEIAALLSKFVIDPETGSPLGDLPEPIEGPRAKLLADLPSMTNVPDGDYRLVLRFCKEDGTETCFAINEHVWHAAQHELNRRLCDHVYNCQVLAARLAQGKKSPNRFDKAVDVIAKVAAQQAKQVVAGAERRVAIAHALLEHLPESFTALASFAFSGRLPKGFVTGLKRAEKTALKDTTAFEINSMTRHLRNLSDASDGEDDLGKYYTFDGKFPHSLGQKLNRRRLGPRLDRAHRLAAADYRGGGGKQKNQRMLDILGWARVKRLILHLRQAEDVKGLAAFADAWGLDDPLKIAKDLAKDAKAQIDLFAKNYPNFERYPPYPDGKAPATTKDLLFSPPEQEEEEAEEVEGEEEKEEEEGEKSLSRDALLLAAMKAFVLTSEQDSPEGTNLSIHQVSPNVRAKLLHMIYTHEFLMTQVSEADKTILEHNELRPGGLRCLVDMPALIPSIALAKTLGWAVSDIVRNPYVVEKSLQQPLPDQVDGKDVPVDKKTGTRITLERAETRKMKSFSHPRKNYSDAVQEVLAILAAAQALGATEKDWASFVALVDDLWAKRVKVLAASGGKKEQEEEEEGEGEEEEAAKDFRAAGLGESKILFEDLQKPAKKAFETFAKAVREGLKDVTSGITRSLKAENNDKLKPLPLPLSSESPTIGKIQDFSTIEGILRDGTVISIAEVLKDLEVVKSGKHWEVEVKGEQIALTGGFRPGSIPFFINVKPLSKDKIRKYDAFFGGKAKNPLRPEIGIEGHRVSERDTREGKIAGWKSTYETRVKNLKKEIKATLATMHQLRAFKLGIERRLASRPDTVVDLVRLGFDASDIAKELLNRDMGVKEEEGGSLVGLTSAERDAVKAAIKKPSTVKDLSKSILMDSPDDAGARVDQLIGTAKGARDRVKKLQKLLGGIAVRTWGKKGLQRAAARGEKLAGIIGLHLTRLGFHLRELRAQRDFYLASSERIDRAGKDEARLEKKQAGTAKGFDEALKRLRQPGLFVAFRDGNILPCEIPLAKGLPAAKEVEVKGKKTTVYECKGRLLGKILRKGTVDGVQVQTPLYPSGTVAANVFVKGHTLVAHAPTSLAKWQEETFKGKNDKSLVSSLDINRLLCPRTITPGLVEIVSGDGGSKLPADPKTKIEDWDLEFDHWARLADVYDYTRKRPNQYEGKEKRSKGGGTKDVFPAAAFYRKVVAAAFAPAGEAITLARPDSSSSAAPKPSIDTTTLPSEDAPYDIEAKKVPLNFRDKLGVLMKYRGHKHAHLERKKPAIIRKMKGLAEFERGHLLRARTALYFVNRACNHVRDADLVYLFHAFHYCQARSGAAFIAHENLGLSPGGEGGLGRIVSSMLKDFKPAKNYLVRQFKGLEREPKNTPKMDGVSPAYTSQTCNYCARLGVKGTLDDSASADHAICDKCGHVYDRHGSAASNIGDRLVQTRFGKKKTKRKKGDAKEGKG